MGGTKIAVAAIDGASATNAVEHPTEVASTAALLDGLEGAVREVIASVGTPAAIGVGVPSQVDRATGTVETSVNIPLQGVALRGELERRFGVPVSVDNDANCAALAETRLVDDPPARHLVMLTLGTGVGGGAVVDGRLLHGADGLGGELGHVTVNPDGPPCPGSCPNHGCLEAYCSGQALERDATQLARDRPDSQLARMLADDGRVSGRELVRVAQEGDQDALLILERFARMLGIGIAAYVNVFQPHHLVIGGGLSRASDLFLERAQLEAASRALPALWRRTTVALARGGADAGVIGAGLLAAQESGRDTPPTRRTEGAG